jgi:hypothetical protein
MKKRMKAARERAGPSLCSDEPEGREDRVMLCTLKRGCVGKTVIIKGELFQL